VARLLPSMRRNHSLTCAFICLGSSAGAGGDSLCTANLRRANTIEIAAAPAIDAVSTTNSHEGKAV